MNQNKWIIVLTGGIASGKSTVGKILRKKEYKVVESDKIVHNLYIEGSCVYEKLIDEFGTEISDGKKIDRKKLSKIVYNNKEKIKTLNNIVHKHVVEELMRSVAKSNENIIFLDIPLMIEEKEKLEFYGLKYDQIWLVKTNEEIRLKRIMKRDNKNISEVKKIFENQMKDEEKEKFADKVIENNKGLNELEENIDKTLTIFKIEKDLN